MNILSFIFLVSLLAGGLLRIPLYKGIGIYPHDLILVVLVLFWIYRNKKQIQTRTVHFPFPFLLFFLSILISLSVNFKPQMLSEFAEGLAYAARFFLYTILYLIVSHTKNVSRWLMGLYSVGCVFTLLGISQYLLYPNLRNLSYLGWDPHYYRLFSTFLDPNFAGLFILLTFILGLYMVDRFPKSIVIPMQLILFSGLLLTLSRSSYVATIGVIIAYAYMQRSWKILGVVALFIGILILAPFPQRGFTPLLRMESSIARIGNWTESISLIQKAPVFGHGFNLLRSIQDPTDMDNTQVSHATSGVDNSVLFVLATTGLVGGAAFLFLLSFLWMQGKRLLALKRERTFGIVYLLSLVAIGIHSMFVNSLFYPWILIWLWIMTGIAERKHS